MQTKRLTTKPTQEVIAAIQALDLTSVKTRVMDPELGEGWTQEYADSIEVAFKHYLSMVVKYQEEAEDIMLAKDVDEFWHTYILQTMKYMDDCERVFGTYLHHSPHVGEVTEADHEKRAALAEKTRELYEREFGGASGAEAAWAGKMSKSPAPEDTIATVPVEHAAMSSVAIHAKLAAMSSVAIGAGDAAMSSIAIRSVNAAMSSIAIHPERAAMSSVAIGAANAAMSSVAVRAENAAMSSVAIRSGNAAMSSVAIRAANAAMSSVAVRPENAAMSSIAIRSENAAMSSVAIGAAPAMSSVAVRAS